MRKQKGKPMKRKLVSVEEFAVRIGVDVSVVRDEIRKWKFHKSVVRDDLGVVNIVLYDGIFEWRSKDDKKEYSPGVPRNAFASIKGLFAEAIRPDDDDEDTDRVGND